MQHSQLSRTVLKTANRKAGGQKIFGKNMRKFLNSERHREKEKRKKKEERKRKKRKKKR